ncbi:MAG: hypothetical protein JXB32_01790, partial [Deltaproteobacteria bacterium]|nr:hypothetical protein [Deltaproteobacteria bacterium]
MMRCGSGILVAAAMSVVGCDSTSENDPCLGVGCSSHGRCYPASGAPYCFCFGGYHPEGLDCAANDPDDPCLGADCADHGTCIVLAGSPECVCDPGYDHPEGYVLLCTPDGHDGPVDVPPCTPSGPELCNVADDDCNGLTDEGFHLDLDAANCGHCGNACTVRDHATEAV